MTTPDALVIGAGPAGLATAAALKARGLSSVVLERTDGVGSSWRGHYDRLHLHTPRELSHLPGFKIPAEMGRWIARDDVVRYLELYRQHHDLTVEHGVTVTGIERDRATGEWVLTDDAGVERRAPFVVVATGFNHTPKVPDFPGQQGFSGEIALAKDYRNGAPYVGRSVMVVGTGNTGTEIAVDLAEHGASTVWLSVRTVPHILRRNVGPLATQYTGISIRRLPKKLVDRAAKVVVRASVPDLTEHGLPRPDTGLLSRAVDDNAIPVQDVGLIKAVQAGQVKPVRALTSFEGADAVLDDGTRVQPDVVLLATGYTQGLERLLGPMGVLDDRGRPLVHGGRDAPGAPGLWFNGYTNPISGMLREIRIDAQKIARAMASAKSARGEQASQTPGTRVG